jgi:hypothetical protein
MTKRRGYSGPGRLHDVEDILVNLFVIRRIYYFAAKLYDIR